MRVDDLHHEELLELDPEGGVIRFAGQRALLRYEWPGNVRELENAMERAVALARGTRVELEDLPEEIRQAFPRPVVHRDTVQPLSKVEKEYILAVLELNGGNQTRSAEQLGIGSATLYRKLKKYGLIGKTPTRRNKSSDAADR